MVDVELLIGRIAVEVGRQMERIGVLTGQATCILRLMMRSWQVMAMYRRSLVCDDTCEKARQKIEDIKAMPELDREPQRVAAVNRPLVCEHRPRSNLDAGGFYRSL